MGHDRTMTRLPFDPDKMPRRDPKPAKSAKAAEQPISVSRLSELIKGVLVESFASKIRVVGEVSNFSPRGHWYFSLKDEGAAIKCVCFASSARSIKFPVKDGMQVVVSGRVDYYEVGGQLGWGRLNFGSGRCAKSLGDWVISTRAVRGRSRWCR